MKNKITLLFVMLALAACNNADSEANEKDKIKLAHGLLGKWQQKSVDGVLTENWLKVNDSTYLGASYFIKNKDTLHYESITLQQIGEELSYNTSVRGQNNDKPIRLRLTDSAENQLTFENLKNDYPQKISYSQISNTNYLVVISGIQNGKASSEKFKMTKTK